MLRTLCWTALLIAALVPVPGSAQTDPSTGALSCSVERDTVYLSWNLAFFAPIQGYVIGRDGVEIAVLGEEATEFKDPGVAPGAHIYTLIVINFNGGMGVVGQCSVQVGEPQSGLRCKADGRRVHLEWGPILITVVIENFLVYRNGDLVATLPGNVLTYDDGVPTVGDYGYKVLAKVGPDSSFLIGECKTSVDCFNLGSAVDGLKVVLEWAFPVPGTDPVVIDPVFFIQRDGQPLGTTQESRFVDEVPGPGRYVYEVLVDLGTGGLRIFLFAACRVSVPGDVPPSPEGLTCSVVLCRESDPTDPATGDGNGTPPFPFTCVLLEWKDPVAYDKILVLCNGMLIASLPGGATSYWDSVVGGGLFTYEVLGLLADNKSLPARCRVEVPPSEVPPPQDLSCALLEITLRPEDPDATTDGGVPPLPGEVSSFNAVVINWWNPIRYAGIVVSRNKAIIARLPGDAMMFRDIAPPEGLHIYGVQGFLDDGRSSPIATCEVFVGPVVPPVEDLICGAQEKVNPDTVDLAWNNGAAYDGIAIFRNQEPITKLPGDATAYQDAGLAPGVYVYGVVGILGDAMSAPAYCQAVIEGPPEGNLLYFSGSFPWPSPLAGMPPLPGNRITCLATNADAVQGWSFGVQSDPKYITPVKFDLEDTATAKFNAGAGPGFIHVSLLKEGVTMAVIIETPDTPTADVETLPPGQAWPLLNIEYAGGASVADAERYRVQYSDALGDPPVQVLFVVKGFEVRPRTLPGWVSLPGVEFLRGDTDGNGRMEITDAVNLLGWLFMGEEEPGCLQAADVNGSGRVNIADAVYLFSFLFLGGDAPPWPYPECGAAPAPLGCKDPGSCL